MLKASILVFGENPIWGIGLGNWQSNIYQYDFSHITEFNNPEKFIRYHSHNLYTKYLVELGLVGLLAFLYSVATLLRRSLSFKKELDGYEQAAFAAVLVFLFTAFFYADVNFYEYHFSGIHLLVFCALGILSSKNSETFYTLPSSMNRVFLGVSIACLIWFSYAKYNYNIFFNTQKQLTHQSSETSIQQLESLYHPVFYTILIINYLYL